MKSPFRLLLLSMLLIALTFAFTSCSESGRRRSAPCECVDKAATASTTAAELKESKPEAELSYLYQDPTGRVYEGFPGIYAFQEIGDRAIIVTSSDSFKYHVLQVDLKPGWDKYHEIYHDEDGVTFEFIRVTRIK
jgi:hypothetical protein